MKNILLFTKDGCNPCKSLKNKVSLLIEDSKISVVNITRDYINKYNLVSAPTLIFLEDDIEVNRVVGDNKDVLDVINNFFNV